MARVRLAGRAFLSWADVDEALREIGEIERDLNKIETAQNASIDQIKDQAKAAARPLQARKTALEKAMQAYCDARRGDLGTAKSRQLTFGTVSYRQSTKVVIKRLADTVQALHRLGLTHCIRITETPDKDKIKSLPQDVLAQIGVSLKTGDVFGYEVDKAHLQEMQRTGEAA